MAAPRAMADHLGTRPPDLTLVPSPNAAIDQTNHERLEQVVWELAGLDLEIDRGTGEPFRWQDRSMLFDMRAVLGPAARLRDDVLGPGPAGGPVSATVRIAAGIGDARQIADRTSDFVRLNAPLGEPVLSGLTLADYVEVRLVVPKEDPSLVIRVRRRGAPDPVSAIVLQADPDIPTVVSFSNLCARVPASACDAEFAGLYEVFEEPDLARTRLVPRVRDTLVGKIDCYSPVYLHL
jgi:hypothetical protein